MGGKTWDAVLIDLDGTLVDTMGDFVLALNLMLSELELPPVRRPVVEQLVGKGSEHLIASTLAHVGGAAATARFDDAWAAYQRHYRAINGRASAVYPGVPQGLHLLRQAGLPLACLTNKPLAFARELLAAKALDGYFMQVFGGDSFEKKKPDPMPVLGACQALGSEPARTLVVGDSQNDGLAARAAGCPVWLVTYGYNHGEPIAEAPHDRLIGSLAEVGEALQACDGNT